MASPIVGLTAQLQFSLTGTGYLVDPLQGNIPLSSSLNLQQAFANASPLPSGAVLADQMRVYPITVAASGTTTVDLTAALANIVQSSTATFDKIVALVLYLPTPAKAPASLGIRVQSTGVNVGNAGSNPFPGFCSVGTDLLVLVPGRMIVGMDTVTGTWMPVLSTTKNLMFTNLDTVNIATVLVGLLGQQA